MLNSWSALICGSSMVCILIELLLPPGKMEKTVRIVLNVFFLCVLIFSIKSIKKINFKFDKIALDGNSQKTQFLQNVNNQLEDASKENVKAVVRGALRAEGIKPQNLEIFMNNMEPNGIPIIKCKVHILKNQMGLASKIKNEIQTKFKIDTEVIESE